MEYKNAQYKKNDLGQSTIIEVTIGDKTSHVPVHVGNTDYDNIMKLVADKKLTIKDAD
tara:strand:- start:2198 stop:2371 length:174 start_codon:yes stop_codon:yes gene_type:complete